MNLTRTIAKLKRQERSGVMVSIQELEQIESTIRAALDAERQDDRPQAIRLLCSLVEVQWNRQSINSSGASDSDASSAYCPPSSCG